MQRVKKITAIILTVLTLSGVCIFGSVFSAGASGTGAGLAEWALNAYYSGWSYVYGGSTPGAVDCSGLIYSYCGGERCGDPQLNTATETGSVSAGIPNVHGLGLWRPGHVGVYVGNNMEVDARGDAYGVCYESIGGYNNWTYWFKLAACSYVTNGWEKFNGEYYYYENGEYITNTSRTIDGTTYYFDSQGRSGQAPSNSSSGSSTSGSSSGGSGNSGNSAPTSWRNGSTGDEVVKIQKRLTELGFYTGAIDGGFGDATEQAYRAFQQAAGLEVDGIAGSDREVLYSDDAPSADKSGSDSGQEPTSPEETAEETTAAENSFKNGDEGETVAQIQQKLALLGYFDIDATGFFGDYTEQAVKNFQLENALAATGIVDEETYDVLFGDSAVANPNPAQTEEAQAPATAPSALSAAANTSPLIISDEQNRIYADAASDVAVKTTRVADKALSKAAPAVASATSAAAKRTANAGLWLVLVAVILGAVAFVFFMRDRKASRYARYCAKKKKKVTKADLSARW